MGRVYSNCMHDPSPPAPDEAAREDAVIARVLAGDREAYRHIVDRYGGRIMGFCRARLKSEDEAGDAAQDVFMRAFSSLHTFRRGESFAAWIFAIAANHVRSRFRILGSERRKAESAAREAAAHPQGIFLSSGARQAEGPQESAERNEAMAAVRRAVAELPAEMRTTLELYYFGELPVADIARALGQGEEAIKSRLFRARKILRARLEFPQPDKGRGGSVP